MVGHICRYSWRYRHFLFCKADISLYSTIISCEIGLDTQHMEAWRLRELGSIDYEWLRTLLFQKLPNLLVLILVFVFKIHCLCNILAAYVLTSVIRGLLLLRSSSLPLLFGSPGLAHLLSLSVEMIGLNSISLRRVRFQDAMVFYLGFCNFRVLALTTSFLVLIVFVLL